MDIDDPDRTTDLDGEPATDDPDRTTDLDGESTRETYLDGVTALMEARAYVATRFYPPLPVAYGDLLVEALDAARRGDAGKRLDVKGLNPQPRCAAADGTVSAADLLDILRIDPDLYTDEDED